MEDRNTAETRIYEARQDKAEADYIAFREEAIDNLVGDMTRTSDMNAPLPRLAAFIIDDEICDIINGAQLLILAYGDESQRSDVRANLRADIENALAAELAGGSQQSLLDDRISQIAREK